MKAVINASQADYRDAFAPDMAAAGLGITTLPADGGNLHRFYVEGDKKQSKHSWYCLFSDGVPAGSYGSWKTGEKFNWCAKPQRDMSTGELQAHRKHLEASKQQRIADTAPDDSAKGGAQ